jgi:hypothetical protein
MKVTVETQAFAEFTPFGALTVSGTRFIVLAPMLERGRGFSLDPNLTAFCGGGAVALLKSKRGWFGWRLTNRQAAALVGAGLMRRSAA